MLLNYSMAYNIPLLLLVSCSRRLCFLRPRLLLQALLFAPTVNGVIMPWMPTTLGFSDNHTPPAFVFVSGLNIFRGLLGAVNRNKT